MTASRLLKSCATPPASWPRLSRRCDWCSWRSSRSRSVWVFSRSRSACSSSRSVTSRTAADHQDALAGVDGRQGDLRRERAAVTAAPGQLDPRAHWPWLWISQIPGPVRRVHRLDRIRDQDLHRLADQLLAPVPEQPLGLRVHQHDPAAGVHAHHRIRCRLHQPEQRVIRELHGKSPPSWRCGRPLAGDPDGSRGKERWRASRAAGTRARPSAGRPWGTGGGRQYRYSRSNLMHVV